MKLLVEMNEDTYLNLKANGEEAIMVAELSGVDDAKIRSLYAKVGELRKEMGAIYKQIDEIYKERNED